MSLSVVILAAGKGTRMKSPLPKVLHKVAGKPMVTHVVETGQQLGANQIIVVHGHGSDQVQDVLSDYPVGYAHQEQQLGTGHAVAQAMGDIADDARVLVLYGDVPLTQVSTLESLLDSPADQVALLTVELKDPTGYGRIIRNDEGKVLAIVEQKDASFEQLQITEGNTGILAAPAGKLRQWLNSLDSDNAQGELYLTDIIAMANADNVAVNAKVVLDESEVLGANDRSQLSVLERAFQARLATQAMKDGLTLFDPNRVDIRGKFTFGQECVVDVNCVFEGTVTLGDNVEIGPNCVIKNTTIGSGTKIEAYTHIEDAEVGEANNLGPYARLRPGTKTAEKAKIGNFVETKKAEIGPGSKLNHLTYVGDAKVGKDVNIGAGTITCNYDGANKYLTTIEDGVFVGSGTQLVAPVTIAKNTTVGAGSTITKDTEADSLVITRARAKSIANWPRPTKNK